MTLKTGVMMLKIQLYHHRNKLHFKMSKLFLYFTILQFLLYFFDQINKALVRYFFQKHCAQFIGARCSKVFIWGLKLGTWNIWHIMACEPLHSKKYLSDFIEILWPLLLCATWNGPSFLITLFAIDSRIIKETRC